MPEHSRCFGSGSIGDHVEHIPGEVCVGALAI